MLVGVKYRRVNYCMFHSCVGCIHKTKRFQSFVKEVNPVVICIFMHVSYIHSVVDRKQQKLILVKILQPTVIWLQKETEITRTTNG